LLAGGEMNKVAAAAAAVGSSPQCVDLSITSGRDVASEPASAEVRGNSGLKDASILLWRAGLPTARLAARK